MRIAVTAPFSYGRRYISRPTLRNRLLKYAAEVRPDLMILALQELDRPKLQGDYARCSIGHLRKLGDEKEKIILERCMSFSCSEKCMRDTYNVLVEPTVTVGGLKSLLNEQPWVPKENLMLVQNMERALEDDSSTLEECCVKDQDTLLACTSGSFPLNVHWFKDGDCIEFHIPISNCLETVRQVREKIHEVTGLVPEKQSLSHYYKDRFDNEETRLVAFGITRPCLGDKMEKSYLSLYSMNIEEDSGSETEGCRESGM